MNNPFNKESRAGLYITVIFHLTVIIVLLVYQIDATVRREESFVLDFSKQEEIERIEKEIAFKEDISKRLDDLIAAAHNSGEPIRNIAVDASRAQLKDDRGTDADQLYKDAERLANDLKNGHKDAVEEDAREETVEMQHQKKPDQKNQKEYSGPSVLSYTLDGRKASHLPIPAYRCYGAGDVTVIIKVNNSGQVVSAKVMEEISSGDNCLRSFAIRAARLSRFSASSTAPANQTGEIVYRFIAQ
ncbi:MAG: energy transducer TonB [Bacteroidales bacterium]|nr:energy transducer TonB [Bacteroidales bacterium]MBQ8484106.1 energy transducer TonB [Bacteroidales bacterium]